MGIPKFGFERLAPSRRVINSPSDGRNRARPIVCPRLLSSARGASSLIEDYRESAVRPTG